MKLYKLQCQTTTGAFPWEHDIWMASDAMAIEFAVRTVQSQFPGVRWFMSLIVWEMKGENKIAEIKLNYPVAYVVK